MNNNQVADNLKDMLIIWAEELEEKTENATCQMLVAREKALGTIISMSTEYLLKYFQIAAEEIQQDKPLEKMTDKEKLEVMKHIFNGEAIEA